MDTEKAFDCLEHSILISALIEILLKDQQLRVINSGTTTQYVHLERGNCQGDPISAYLPILELQILFLLIKKHPKTKDIEIFEHSSLYPAYADDTALF